MPPFKLSLRSKSLSKSIPIGLITITHLFEWKAIKGQKTKQPYAISMKSGKPFALAAIWKN